MTDRASEWASGDQGYYRLRCGNGLQDLYLAVTVISVTSKRVVVRSNVGFGGHRVLKAERLVKSYPKGAWVNDRTAM